MSEFGGLECFWSDLKKHPTCPHGPTLLFGKYSDGELKQFYTCSACRDRKQCTFYAEKNATVTEAQKKAWKMEAKKSMPPYNHRRLFIRFNELMVESLERRAYCHSCNKLIPFIERTKHSDHEMQIGLSDEEMNNPTMILKPLANVKKEAQYLFSKKATTQITDMLKNAGAQQVLCIGAPRIHEYITQKFGHKMSSLLLDFDGRFHNFFGPLSYCWYNLFNNHFFTEEGAQTFRDFVMQNNGKNMFIVCDPPFGGRVEAISQTLKTIMDQHKEWNNIENEDSRLKIFFIFPYFMESIMRQKSNPPGVDGGLKDLSMADYKVDYDNHPLFVTGSNGRKHGSPVRIFTNISLKLMELPAEDGYKYCKRCEKWIAAENKHCKKCKGCTSKDGRRYKHCNLCQRCVKPTWKHCKVCERCVLESHKCGEKPKLTGRCYECGGSDHVRKDCQKTNEISEQSSEPKGSKKRKNKTNGIETVGKKLKVSVLSDTETGGKVKKIKTNGIGKVEKKLKVSVLSDTETGGKVKKIKTNGIEKIGKKLKVSVLSDAVTGPKVKKIKTKTVSVGKIDGIGTMAKKRKATVASEIENKSTAKVKKPATNTISVKKEKERVIKKHKAVSPKVSAAAVKKTTKFTKQKKQKTSESDT